MRNSTIFLKILTITIISPYVIGGARLDSIFFYIISLFLLSYYILVCRVVFSYGLIFSIYLISALLFCLIGNLFVDHNFHYVSIYAAINMLLLPAVTCLVFSHYINRVSFVNIYEILRLLLYLTVIFTFFSILSTVVDIKFISQYFIRNAGSSNYSISDLAMTNGRFSGLFAQPLEAGIFFSISGFVAVFLKKINFIQIRFFILTFLCSFIGGALALTKMYLLVGFPLSMYLLYRYEKKLFYKIFLFFIIVPTMYFIYILFNSNLLGLLSSYINIYDRLGFLGMITAGRIGGTGSTTGWIYSTVTENGFWNGLGLGNNNFPLDSGYLLYYFQGGIMALIFYMLIPVSLFQLSFRREIDTEIKQLLRVLGWFILLASVGGPVLNANRAGVAVVLLMICVLQLCCGKKSYGNESFSDK